jgi:hypothetical protein
MKKILLILALTLTTLTAFSQNSLDYRIESYACKTYVDGIWSAWSKFESTNLTLTLTDTTIGIDSKEPQLYTIIVDSYSTKIKSDSFKYDSWDVVDIQGLCAKVTLISKNNTLYYVLINYEDVKWIYGISK